MTQPPRKRLPAKTKKAIAIASAKPDALEIVREMIDATTTPALNNRNLKAEHCQMILDRVAGGETVQQICAELGISTRVVNQRAYLVKEFGAELARARAMSAFTQVEYALQVAMDMDIPTDRARLIGDRLDKLTRVYNREAFGDKPLIGLNSPSITFTISPTDLDFGG